MTIRDFLIEPFVWYSVTVAGLAITLFLFFDLQNKVTLTTVASTTLICLLIYVFMTYKRAVGK